jgi:type I phosphodiesterase/nucleotide pyrophosphatase
VRNSGDATEGRAGSSRRVGPFAIEGKGFQLRKVVSPLIAVAMVVAGFAVPAAFGNGNHRDGHGPKQSSKLLMFVSDGMRMDQTERYADQGVMPSYRRLLREGAKASGHGLLTQAPPNTGAGWYTLFTGAWPAVHGSTNNTFHINGQPFNTSKPAFSPNVLQAESLAQAAERAGKKVAQIEYAGGARAPIDGPTLDYRNFRSGRGVVTNYTSSTDLPQFIASFRLQYDKQEPAPATGWTHVPTSYSPAKEMRLRVLDGAVDKYGLNAYIYDGRDDGTTRYDRVLFSRTQDGDDSVADLEEGEWADVKVKIEGNPPPAAPDPLDGKTGSFLLKVERLTGDLSQVRLFHTSVTRAIASWNTWPGEPGFSGSFEDFIAERFPSSQSADFAVLESGIVSEDTYVQQGLYWEKSYWPIIEYVLDTYRPDLALVGFSETDEFQHQFLGLVTKKLPNGARNPAYDDIEVNGTPDGRVHERAEYIREAYAGADETLKLGQAHMHDRRLTTFTASDHGFAPQFAAVDASNPLVDLGLLSKPQTSNCAPAEGDTKALAKACWAGGTAQIYLNVKDRDPALAGMPQIAQDDVDATVARIRRAYRLLADPNDWTGDGRPEHWKLIDRMYTKAEARYIPNGPHSTADMSHPTRTGDLVVFSYPPYEFDAATPGTLVARSAFFGQHGYVPDVQDLRSNTNMRATFIADGPRIRHRTARDVRSIDVAPTAAFVLGVPEPQNSQGVVRRDLFEDRRDW